MVTRPHLDDLLKIGASLDGFDFESRELAVEEAKRYTAAQDKARDRLRHLAPSELHAIRGQVFETLDELKRTAEEENRVMTTDEANEYYRAVFAWRAIDDLVEAIPAHLRTKPSRPPAFGGPAEPSSTAPPAFGAGEPAWPAAARGGHVSQAPVTAPVRRAGDHVALTRSQSVAGWASDQFKVRPEDVTLDRYIRGRETSNWDGAEAELELFQRAQAIAPATAGGFLVPEELSTRVIDLARNQTRVIEAGALTVPMTTSTLKIARVAGDPTAAWRAENATITDSDASFEAIVFTAKSLAALVKASLEVVEDAQALPGLIEQTLAASLALELDRAALRGSGVDPEPLGVLNHADVTKTALAASLTNYDDFSQSVQRIWQANGTPAGVIYSPRTAGVLDRLKDTTNQPLVPPPSFQALRRLVTNQIPENLGAGTNETEAYIADWSQLLIGTRTTLQLDVSREASDSSGSAFKNLQVWIRAYLRADVAIAQPGFFEVLTEILP